ncbi:Nectarin-2 [Orbilia brochopaga]|nr:Nectarin-2 [Drechslerella brochopaga]
MHLSSLATTLATLLSIASACDSCTGNIQRREEHGGSGGGGSEGAGGEAGFSYLGLTGPVDWNQFAQACGDGKTQSPINVVSTMKTSSYGDKGEYADIGAVGFNFTNTGHTVEVFYKGQSATLGGVEYELQRFHFHTPSEHRLDNEWFPMEVHFVHQGKNDPSKLAVVGIFIDTTGERSDPMMERLATYLQSIGNVGDTVVATGVPLDGVRTAITNAKKFTYPGSLTTPPCTEGVTWYVSNTILDISTKDYKAFKKVLGFNSRTLQADPGKQNIVDFAAQFLPSVQGRVQAKKQRRAEKWSA